MAVSSISLAPYLTHRLQIFVEKPGHFTSDMRDAVLEPLVMASLTARGPFDWAISDIGTPYGQKERHHFCSSQLLK